MYDAIYRLIRTTGREHAGQIAPNTQPTHSDIPIISAPHPNDPTAMRNYTQQYEYDDVGNIMKMIHTATNGSWTRFYDYENTSNRLNATSQPGDTATGPYSAHYQHDLHGNMIAMPHLPGLQWDYKDRLKEVDIGGGGTAYYVYDASGQRARKVVVYQNGTVKERLYLGGFEIYREYTSEAALANSTIKKERETLHIMDDKERIALVETKTRDEGASIPSSTPLFRYQLSNHLGSAMLEVDENGLVISYEEYHPYGTTSYHSTRSGVEVSLKRYRYTGKEKDEETGLYYHGARYYACWLGRWTSADPKRLLDGCCLYEFVQNSPIILIDQEGRQASAPLSQRDQIEAMRAQLNYLNNAVANTRTEIETLTETARKNEEEVVGRMNLLKEQGGDEALSSQIEDLFVRNVQIQKKITGLSSELRQLEFEREQTIYELQYLEASVAEKEREVTNALNSLGVGGGKPTFSSESERELFVFRLSNTAWRSLSAREQEVVADALSLRQGGGGAPPQNLPRQAEVSVGVTGAITMVSPCGMGRIGLNLQVGGGNSGLYFLHAIGPEDFTGFDIGVSGGLNAAHGRGPWSGPFNTAGGNILVYGIDYFESPGGGFNGVEGWEGFGPSIGFGSLVGLTAGRENYVPIIGGR